MTLDDSALTVQPPALLAPGAAPGAAGHEYPYDFSSQYPELPRGRFSAFLSRLGERAPWIVPAGIGLLIVAAISYTLIIRPVSKPSTCLLHVLTGFDCPGCGGTRSAWFLLHGDVANAARYHAPFVFAVPFLLYTYVAYSVGRISRWRLPRLPLTPRVLMIFMALWLVYTVLRNLPWAPFTSLYV